MSKIQSLEQRLLAHRIIDADGCWISTYKHRNPSGHPMIAIDSLTKEYVSHTAYKLWIGPLSDNPRMKVLHRCDKSACFKPECLYQGTTKQNALDLKERGHVIYSQGETHYNAKLSDVDVALIRAFYATHKYTQTQLAHKYNVARSHIARIVNYKQRKRKVAAQQ